MQQATEDNTENVNMRKFAREHIQKYPSVKKVYTAIAGLFAAIIVVGAIMTILLLRKRP